ncbi:MAG TPA: GNAT family N-acetyltransferase [Candidatus Bilamarchaeaceae archaeon]|nr:GNAT family N-acetyltransferase [Candidatus Bilamarchaeaceae archaeon]
MEKVEIKLAACIEEVLEILAIRRTVFIEEQEVPEERERDGYDKNAVHVILKVDGEPAGTARLRTLGKGKIKIMRSTNRSHSSSKNLKIERMAILKPYRKKGFGEEMMVFIGQYAKMHKIKKLVIHSQWQARDFYKRLGFRQHGKPFMDAGIRHIEMVKKLG